MAEVVLDKPMLWATLLIPLAAGVGVVATRRGRVATLVCGFSWALVLLSLVALAPVIYSVEQAIVILDPWYAEVPGIGVFGLMVDGVSLAFALGIAAVSLAVALYSYRYMEHRFKELGVAPNWGLYFLLYQLFTLGMLGVVYSINTIQLYLFLELTLIPSFLLIALYGYGDRVRVGLLYLVWTHLGAALFVVALLLTGSITGVYNIYLPGKGYVLGVGEALGGLKWGAFTLLVLGLAIKMALLGVHMWLPYAHAEAPTPISALLSPLLIGLGAYGMLRVVITFFPYEWATSSYLLVAWAFATMIYGGLMALVQRDVKRFLAYSSISQMGYLLLGLASTTYSGVVGATLHYVAHALGKAILFAVAGTLIVTVHTRDLGSMGGLAQKLPYTASAALIGFLHLTGIPPTLGLLSEYLIARGLAEWSSAISSSHFIAGLAAFMTAITISTLYSFIGFRKMFLGPLGPAGQREGISEPASMIGPILFLGLMGVALFLFPEPLAGPVKSVAQTIVAASR
jgi:NADH-quinone oxidoreductase subunit M